MTKFFLEIVTININIAIRIERIIKFCVIYAIEKPSPNNTDKKTRIESITP
jgi:hypothetical protein